MESKPMENLVFVLMARMRCDDLPLRVFLNDVSMGHWLQFSKGALEDDIEAVAVRHNLPISELLRIESWKYCNGELVEIEHVMGFEHLLDLEI